MLDCNCASARNYGTIVKKGHENGRCLCKLDLFEWVEVCKYYNAMVIIYITCFNIHKFDSFPTECINPLLSILAVNTNVSFHGAERIQNVTFTTQVKKSLSLVRLCKFTTLFIVFCREPD